MNEIIGQFMGIEAPQVYTRRGVDNLPAGPCPELIFGIELEIERVTPDYSIHGFRVEEDRSLRNNGWEFISSPMHYKTLNNRLQTFFTTNIINEDNYSERCSVHVHTNCVDLTFEQLSNIMMLYQVFEKVLFNFIGADRDKNIFCVPLSETTITHDIVNRIFEKDSNVFKDWQKYTALNLIPLTTQGTIEWRHMAGTCDVEFILTWLRLISWIYVEAKSKSYNELKDTLVNLNNTSHYKNLLDTVFKEDAHYLITPQYEKFLEEGVLNLKYSLIKKVKKSITSYLNEARAMRPNPEEFSILWGTTAATARPVPQI